jgi:hypothetical protein
MIRFLHLIAISLLIGSAAYAYSTKYETLYYAETLAKLKTKLQRERETIAIAKAEWAMLTRPDRLQKIVDKHLDLQPMTISQLARLSDIPNRPEKDFIAQKLESLGLEPETTSSTGAGPAKPKPSPQGAPKRDGIAALIGNLGQKPEKRTVAMQPPNAKPAATKTAAAKPASKPAPPAGAAAPAKPAAR